MNTSTVGGSLVLLSVPISNALFHAFRDKERHSSIWELAGCHLLMTVTAPVMVVALPMLMFIMKRLR